MDLTKKIKPCDVFYDHEGDSFVAYKVTPTWVESECGRDFDESDIDFDIKSPVSEVCVSNKHFDGKDYRDCLEDFVEVFNARYKPGDIIISICNGAKNQVLRSAIKGDFRLGRTWHDSVVTNSNLLNNSATIYSASGNKWATVVSRTEPEPIREPVMSFKDQLEIYKKDLDLFARHFNVRFKSGDNLNNGNLIGSCKSNFTIKGNITKDSFFIGLNDIFICDNNTDSCNWTVFNAVFNEKGWVNLVSSKSNSSSEVPDVFPVKSPCPLGEEFRAKEKSSISAKNKSYSVDIVKPFVPSTKPMDIKVTASAPRKYNLDITVEKLPEPMKIVLSNKPIKLNF